MAMDKKQKDDRFLKEVEEGLENLYSNEGIRYFIEAQKLEAKQLEEKKEEYLTGESEGMEAQEQGHLASSK